MDFVWAILSAIVTGLIIGALARLVVPGTRGISIIVTILLGIAGAIVGSLVYGLLGGGDTSGIDWIRLVVEVIVAAVFVWIYVAVSGRRSNV
ncbi:MAG: GlsB/YeaQ/YmgE family stress response membrane protein [Actinomycetota bacterium]|nr:GlsB/YeaQ/YmgE family stress response membrane protein [Actinomycetota bacterium]